VLRAQPPQQKTPTSKLGPPGSQKRKKTIFDSDSEGDNQNNAGDGDGDGPIEITTIGGLEEPPRPTARETQTAGRPPTGKPNIKPLNKSSIFADEEEEQEPQAMPLGLNPAKNKPSAPPSTEFTNLSALRSSKKHAEDAQQLDPTIYSYDAIYDSLHAAKADKAKAASPDGKSDGPRYMTSLLRSAEIRKRDQLRARDRLLAKEREAEGDEFADKEKFVTSAYKAQQEELRRIEQEEAERERQEEERRKQNGGTGMVGFYRDMLSRDEQRHEEVVRAAEEAARRVQAGEIPADEATAEAEAEANKEKTEAQIAAELNAKGAHVAINDEGEIVDKRQLLSAGLNVAPKPKPSASASAAAAAARAAANKSRFDSGHHAARTSQRARQTEMVAQQLEEKARQEAEAEAARQREIAERTRTRKTETDVMSAKERYLARKREREEAAKKGS
ncbi:splicing regulator NSRP1-like domain-containing protein, partial [Aspergillus novofumigatus IBT 16806]